MTYELNKEGFYFKKSLGENKAIYSLCEIMKNFQVLEESLKEYLNWWYKKIRNPMKTWLLWFYTCFISKLNSPIQDKNKNTKASAGNIPVCKNEMNNS